MLLLLIQLYNQLVAKGRHLRMDEFPARNSVRCGHFVFHLAEQPYQATNY